MPAGTDGIATIFRECAQLMKVSTDHLAKVVVDLDEHRTAQLLRQLSESEGHETLKALQELIFRRPLRPALPAGVQTHSINAVRRMSPEKRWRWGEGISREANKGVVRTFRVVKSPDSEFPILEDTTRVVDSYEELPGGGGIAREIKTYGTHRSEVLESGEVITHKVEVPLNPHIKWQIAKDRQLRERHGKDYDPIWEFVGAPPSKALRDELARANIRSVIHN